MRHCMNFAILCLSEKLDCDYPYALGLYQMLKEADEDGRLELLSHERLMADLGITSRQMSQKLSQIKRDTLRDMIRDITRDMKRDKERDRQRDYRERKRGGPSSPLPPTPSIPPISPQEKESGDSPLSLRERPPEGVTVVRKRFKKPSLDELTAYAKEIDYNLNAQAFLDYYEGNGWRVGRNPMKDWKATVRQWKRRDEERGLDTSAKHRTDTETEYELDEEQLAAIARINAAHLNFG